MQKSDPLSTFRAKGLFAKRRMLDSEGGVYSDADAAKTLGVTCRAVDERRRKKKLLGLSLGSSYVYPVWQFGQPILKQLGRILATLSNEMNDWDAFIFLLEPNQYSNGKSPLEALRRGNVRSALRAAASYGEHGAA